MNPVNDDAASQLLLRGPTLRDGRQVDVLLRAGVIAAVRPAGELTASVETVDLAGHLLLPAPAEPHTHLDKVYSADVVANPAGDLDSAVTAWLSYRPSMTASEIMPRALKAVRAYVRNGATAIRTHVDVGMDLGLRALAAVLEVRAIVARECDLQIVAFISNPVAGRAGDRSRALLREAIAAGADVVGGCPARDSDPAECIDACLTAAGEYGVPVDLHVDEMLDPEPCTLSLLAGAVAATGFPYGVVASHCVSLGMMPPDRAGEIAKRVAAAGIVVTCLPPTNLYLQGREHRSASPRGLTAVRILRDAGVTVAAGADSLQDPFNPLGRADPLDTAALLVLAGHDAPETAYASVSTQARRALGLTTVDVAPGEPAELLAVRARSVRQAIAESTPDRVVIHKGQVVAHTSVVRHGREHDTTPVTP